MVWEYLVIKTTLAGTVVENRLYNGKSIEETLKYLGDNCWELVHFALVPAYGSDPNPRVHYAFKRPLS